MAIEFDQPMVLVEDEGGQIYEVRADGGGTPFTTAIAGTRQVNPIYLADADGTGKIYRLDVTTAGNLYVTEVLISG